MVVVVCCGVMRCRRLLALVRQLSSEAERSKAEVRAELRQEAEAQDAQIRRVAGWGWGGQGL